MTALELAFENNSFEAADLLIDKLNFRESKSDLILKLLKCENITNINLQDSFERIIKKIKSNQISKQYFRFI